MPIAFADPAGAVANLTIVQPIVQDSFVFGANFLVQHPIGLLMVAMMLLSFGLGLGIRLVRGRRGRK